MRTKIALCVVAAAVAATPVLAWADKGGTATHIKSKEQIRCELFADTDAGKAACGATRAWLTKTGSVLTDRTKINAQQASLPGRAQAAVGSKPKVKGRGKIIPEEIIPAKSSDLFINFDSNSAAISDDAFSQAATLYEALSGVENWEKYKFEVAGHTDAVGSAAYNKQLSLKRAQAVVDLLVARGVNRSHLVVKGYGFTRPIEDLDRTDGMNRRVEIKRLN